MPRRRSRRAVLARAPARVQPSWRGRRRRPRPWQKQPFAWPLSYGKVMAEWRNRHAATARCCTADGVHRIHPGATPRRPAPRADVRLSGRPIVPARSISVHTGVVLSRRRPLRRDGPQRPLRNPQGAPGDGRSAESAAALGAVLRRRDHRVEGTDRPAHVAGADRLRVRPQHVRTATHVHLPGRRLGADARHHADHHERWVSGSSTP